MQILLIVWNVTLMAKAFFMLNKVIELGNTLHKFTATNGDLFYVLALSYHLPSDEIQVFGPQAHHQLCELDGNKVVMHPKQPVGYDIKTPIDHHQSNLPIICSTKCTKKE